MNSPLARLILIVALPALLKAAPLTPADLRVTIGHQPADAMVESTFVVQAGPAGSTLVEGRITNRSSAPVTLGAIAVEFPWLGPDERPALVSAGGTTMGNWPEQLVDAAKGAEAVSGTYLLASQKSGYAMAAFLSWNTFWSKLHYAGGRAWISADGEDRMLGPGQSVPLEKFWLTRGPDWQDLLFGYADEIARALQIKLKPRRTFTGWSTWDYYGRKFTADEVEANLAEVRRDEPRTNLVQIDGGWWPQRGDYTLTRANLPGGMKTVAGSIRAHGLTAGIHLDGMRGDLKAEVARAHPEYFLRDQAGKLICETRMDDGDRLDNIYFDYSNPAAADYMRDAIRGIRRDWGYDYIKIDFLMYGLNEDIRARALKGEPNRRIVPFDPSLTSVERIHRALKAFRAGMGDDAYFLGCSAPFGPVFGHVDALRTGPDISPNFAQYQENCLANGSTFYLLGKVVYNDADYIVVRSKADEDSTLVHNPRKTGGNLALNEAKMWSDYAGLFGGAQIESDNLTILRPERKALFRAANALPHCSRFLPLDYWQHGRGRRDAFQVFLGEDAGRAYLALFNWSNQPRDYALSGDDRIDAAGLEPLESGPAWQGRMGALDLPLAARRSAVYRLPAGVTFDTARRALQISAR